MDPCPSWDGCAACIGRDEDSSTAEPKTVAAEPKTVAAEPKTVAWPTGTALVAVGTESALTHPLHTIALSPRKTSLDVSGDISLQKGQCATICSQSSAQPHLLAVFATHAQQMGCVQHFRLVDVLEHAPLPQNPFAQM